MRNLILPAALILGACSHIEVAPSFELALPVNETGDALKGIWRSDGYGYLIDNRKAEAFAYDITAQSCLQLDTEGAEMSDFFDLVDLSSDGKTARFYTGAEPHKVQYNSVQSVPEMCKTPDPAASPIATFETFVSYFQEHYVFFDLYGVDWGSQIAAARPKVSEETTDAELFDILTGMVSGVKDAHVELVAEIDGERLKFDADDAVIEQIIHTHVASLSEPPENTSAAFFDGYWTENIENQILQGAFNQDPTGRIKYGMASDGIGYMAVISVGRFAADDPTPEENLEALRAVMGQAMTFFEAQSADAVILDLSVNFGGYDYIGRDITSHFIETAQTTYSKQTHDTENRIPPTVFEIEPATGTRFTGPVSVLTSAATVSGGETLTLGLRAIPNVSHYGEPTRGALSDKLGKLLANGWEITLSNEVYLDHEGVLWEGTGVEPEIPLTVFNSSAPLQSHLDAVRHLIDQAKASN